MLIYNLVLPHFDKRFLIKEPVMMVAPESFRQYVNIPRQHFSIIKLSDWAQVDRVEIQLAQTATCYCELCAQQDIYADRTSSLTHNSGWM